MDVSNERLSTTSTRPTENFEDGALSKSKCHCDDPTIVIITSDSYSYVRHLKNNLIAPEVHD